MDAMKVRQVLWLRKLSLPEWCPLCIAALTRALKCQSSVNSIQTRIEVLRGVKATRFRKGDTFNVLLEEEAITPNLGRGRGRLVRASWFTWDSQAGFVKVTPFGLGLRGQF